MTSHANEWDNRYSTTDYIYGIEPNEFLQQQLMLLSVGKLLLPGEGEGRNALWAAKNGWQVTAVDLSQVAQEKAMKLFSRNNVKVTYHIGNIMNLPLEGQFNAIGLSYLHLPKELKRPFAQKMIELLAPKGAVILEMFHPNQIGNTSGGPKNPNLFVTPDELREYFRPLQIKSIETTELHLNEGTHHKGKAIAIRMVATKV